MRLHLCKEKTVQTLWESGPKKGFLPARTHLLTKKVLSAASGEKRFSQPGSAAVCFREKKNAYTVNTPRYCAWCTKIPVPEKIHKSDPGGGSPASPKLANLSVFSMEADGLALWTLEPYLSSFLLSPSPLRIIESQPVPASSSRCLENNKNGCCA